MATITLTATELRAAADRADVYPVGYGFHWFAWNFSGERYPKLEESMKNPALAKHA